MSFTLITAPNSQGDRVRLNVLLSISLNSAGVSSEASKPFRPVTREKGQRKRRIEEKDQRKRGDEMVCR